MRCALWAFRLGAVGIGIFVAAWYSIATSGFRQPTDDYGRTIGPSPGEEIATSAILVVVPGLLIASQEIGRRCSRRTRIRWFVSLAIWTVIVLFVSAGSWHHATNVTPTQTVIAVVFGVLTTVGIIGATRQVSDQPPGTRHGESL